MILTGYMLGYPSVPLGFRASLFCPRLAGWPPVPGKKSKCIEGENVPLVWTERASQPGALPLWAKHRGESCAGTLSWLGSSNRVPLRQEVIQGESVPGRSKGILGGFGTYFQNDWPKFSSRFRFRSKGSICVHHHVTGLDSKLLSILLPFFIRTPQFYLLNPAFLFLCLPHSPQQPSKGS